MENINKTQETVLSKVAVTKELLEQNPHLMNEGIQEGDEIEVEKLNEKVLHPVLLMSKDNFVFKTPEMDVKFYTAMYHLYLKIFAVIGDSDSELNDLMMVYKHFLNSVVMNCVEQGFIQPVTPLELTKIMNEYETKLLKDFEEVNKEVK
jgi:hypothetical protein